jgi:secretion/DNA translocation related CpaE-like protein
MADVGRVVVLTAREDLGTAVVRLAALAGVDVEVVAASEPVRAFWRAARAVVVGCDLAVAVAAAGLPRRADVLVVADCEPDSALWRSAVELGAVRVIVLPADDRALVELLSAATEAIAAAGSCIAVVGGCGGAGASTLAAAVAVTSARANPTVLIDGDPLGGGIDVLLGAEQLSGARWPDLIGTRGRVSAVSLDEALLRVDGLAVLSWDRGGAASLPAAAAVAVVDASLRAFPSVVVDLPRVFDDAATVLAAAADLVVMVVPATVRGTAAAAGVAAQTLTRSPLVQLVVRDAGAGRLSVREVATALGLPVAAALQTESAVAAAAERGEPLLRRRRGSLQDASRLLLAAAAQIRAAA